jgi:hypothetical protein
MLNPEGETEGYSTILVYYTTCPKLSPDAARLGATSQNQCSHKLLRSNELATIGYSSPPLGKNVKKAVLRLEGRCSIQLSYGRNLSKPSLICPLSHQRQAWLARAESLFEKWAD